MTWDLRLGRWQDVLADVTCDAVICDPPYGARTHAGARSLSKQIPDDEKDGISYDGWTDADVSEFVTSWAPRTTRWVAALTSHDLIPAWERAFADVGWYAFAPVGCIFSGMGVRIAGDGPASWTIHLMVARPRTRAAMSWRSLAGGYWGPTSHSGNGRGKPAWIMNALVRDYSNPGDLVCDPCAGHGSTLSAALSNNRRAIGAEVNAEAHAEAMRLLARPLQTDMFGGTAA